MKLTVVVAAVLAVAFPAAALMKFCVNAKNNNNNDHKTKILTKIISNGKKIQLSFER